MGQEGKHTPGPWYQLTGKGGHVHISASVGPHWLNEAYYVGEATAQNAHLIAAAPDLLRALIDLQAAVREYGLLNVNKHFRLCTADAQAGTAIAKAKGE